MKLTESVSARHSKPVSLTNTNGIQIYQLLIITNNFNERKKVLSYTEHDYTELTCKQGLLSSSFLS